MDVEFTRHAKERMEERGISYDDVIHVIDNVDFDLPGTPHNSRKWIGNGVKGQKIVLFVIPEPELKKVVIKSAAVVE